MTKVTVDFNKKIGPFKPMNAVNNGPMPYSASQTWHNFEAYKKLRLPYARTHDASFCSRYGGEHTVDVNFVFPDFGADVNDPASYDFQLTDEYLKSIFDAGTEPFFRLGSKIEHWSKKYNTLPPADFQKWAEICEHIIAHYTEGWASGFDWKIVYWEIWNEPDMRGDDEPAERKPTWGGTQAQFFELYKTTACHLKKRFPHLKIGGPAVANIFTQRLFGAVTVVKPWHKDFLKFVVENKVPLDFFSWHCYTSDVGVILAGAKQARKLLDKYGLTKTESILNEWNYLDGFNGENFATSIKAITGMKGAAFYAAVMSACQNEKVDMLMYYDLQPSVFNGLFDFYTLHPIKGYYSFLSFSELTEMGTQTQASSSDEDVYVLAADGKEGRAIQIVYYPAPNEKNAKDKKVVVHADLSSMQAFLVDEKHDLSPIGASFSGGERAEFILRPYSFLILTVTKKM